MTLDGTVVNGVVVLDGNVALPEGSRVRVDCERFEYPHPLAPYDLEKELALLRASHESLEAGEIGIPLEEFSSQLAREFGFQAASPE